MSPVRIQCEGHSLELGPQETVLEALERGGISIESACRAGVCQSCLMKAQKGTPPTPAQVGLKDSLKRQGYFLACLAHPQEDLEVCSAAHMAGFRGSAVIESIDALGAGVVRVVFQRPQGLEFKAGQFLTFTNGDSLSRSYSIASLPSNPHHFEIHVRRVLQGQMSGWFHEVACPGEEVKISGPRGECFYMSTDPQEALILVGTGTGMAPLRAVVQDALAQGHQGEIWIFDGALVPSRLYLRESFQSLCAAHEQLRYFPCVLREEQVGEGSVLVGDLASIVLERAKALAKGRFYLCGDPTLVQTLKKKLFLAGASLQKIFSDPFVAAAAAPIRDPADSHGANLSAQG